MDNEIFTLIKDEQEKIQLWKDLGASKGELICKGKDDALCRVRISFFNGTKNCLEAGFESPNKMQNNEDYLGYFFLGAEKYYFQAKAKVQDDFVLIPVPAEVYKLQRRQNYRVRLPQTYSAFYNIISINGAPEKITGHLADLSSQGCRVIYRLDAPLLKIGDSVVGHVLIGKRAPIEIQGIVRHIKLEDGNKVTQTFGIEFSPLSKILENKLFAMTMEIHKELFKRPS